MIDFEKGGDLVANPEVSLSDFRLQLDKILISIGLPLEQINAIGENFSNYFAWYKDRKLDTDLINNKFGLTTLIINLGMLSDYLNKSSNDFKQELLELESNLRIILGLLGKFLKIGYFDFIQSVYKEKIVSEFKSEGINLEPNNLVIGRITELMIEVQKKISDQRSIEGFVGLAQKIFDFLSNLLAELNNNLSIDLTAWKGKIDDIIYQVQLFVRELKDNYDYKN